MLVALAFACVLVSQAQSRVVELQIDAQGPVLQGHGACARFEYSSEFSGSLHVWSSTEQGFDTFLRVQDETGALLVEDEDGGGRPTPFVEVEVRPGQRLVIVLAASTLGMGAAARLHLVACPETPVTLAAAEDASVRMVRIRRERDAQDHATARASMESLIDELLAVEGGARSPKVVQALWVGGLASNRLGLLKVTERAWRTVLEARSWMLPEGHLDLQKARMNMAATLDQLGDLSSARVLGEQVCDLLARTRSPDDPDLLKAQANLALTIKHQGDFPACRALQEQILASCERTLPKDDPQLQTARQNLGSTLATMGYLHSARTLYEQALEVRTRVGRPDSADLQILRMNQANLLIELGDLQGAQTLEEQVLDVCIRTMPEDHPNTLRARVNLAEVLAELGKLGPARTLLEQVVALRARTLPADHVDLQVARMDLSRTLLRMGESNSARELAELAVAALARSVSPENPLLQNARRALAAALAALGEQRAARALLEQALEVSGKTLSDESPDLQDLRAALARTLAALRFESQAPGGPDAAFARLAGDYARALERTARDVLIVGGGREAEERSANLLPGLSSVLSFAQGLGVYPADAGLRGTAFLSSERTRGAALITAALARTASKLPGYAGLRAEVLAAGAELAELAQGGADVAALARARARRENAEQALAKLARAVPGSDALLEHEFDGLSGLLGPSDALVGYRRYRRLRIEGEAGLTRSVSVDCLTAFVVRAGGRLEQMELGPLEAVAAAVSAWRAAIGARTERGVAPLSVQPDVTQLGVQLRQLVFDPLLPALDGAAVVTVALDDDLHLVPLDALPAPGAQSGELLGDRWRIRTRATLLELLLHPDPVPAAGGLLALGHPDYDRAPKLDALLVEATAPAPSARAGEQSGLLRGGPWERGFTKLPETRAEVRAIAEYFHDQFGERADLKLLEGAVASRESLLAHASGGRWLHIATHGWFAPESVRSWSDPAPADELSGIGARMSAAEKVRGMSPMLLCGLALAGANLPAERSERIPGLVTAEELSTFDLVNCELAVLSACDTNVGERRAGQGVASLQKALQMAGARSVITSLWKVPDEATKELMLDFYRRLWVEKKPKWQALWEAKRKLRDEKDETGKLRYTTRDWAAWVLTGEPD